MINGATEDFGSLTRWAGRLDRGDQDRLLLALANLLGGEPLGPRSRELFESLLPQLARDAEADTRRELVHRLSVANWAPAALVEELSSDPDGHAQLLLARSPVLSEAAAATLVARGGPEVRLALGTNLQVSMDAETLDGLIESSRRSAALRAPLARRPDLSADQAARLASWSSPPLRRALAARFGLETLPARPEPVEETAARVVEKLGRSGRLTPDYALSALRRGRLDLFQQAMATLSGVPADVLHRASQSEDPADLALACAAVGVDRAVFPEILREVRATNGGRPAEAPGAAAAVIAAFARPQGDAAAALRAGHERRAARWGAG